MQNIFIELLPPWIETGLQPAFYDKESGSVLQQTARMYAKLNELVGSVNNQNSTITDYIDQFNQLHDYVDDYFEDVNVQNEINNKLDSMAEDGQLAEVFSDYFASYVDPQIEAQNRRISVVEDQVNSAVSGQPKVVSSTSQMSDHNQIYVNTTDNKWYYWNGSAWTAGGSYPASSIGNGSVTFGKLSNQLAGYITEANNDVTKLNMLQFNNNANSVNLTTPMLIKAGTTVTIGDDFVENYKWRFCRVPVNAPISLLTTGQLVNNLTTDTTYTFTNDEYCVFQWIPRDDNWNTTTYTVDRLYKPTNDDLSLTYYWVKNDKYKLVDVSSTQIYNTLFCGVAYGSGNVFYDCHRFETERIYSAYPILLHVKEGFQYAIRWYADNTNGSASTSDIGWSTGDRILDANKWFAICFKGVNNESINEIVDYSSIFDLSSYANFSYVDSYVDSKTSGVGLTYNYKGINLDMQYKHGYTYEASTPLAQEYRGIQGFTIYGNYIFQFYASGSGVLRIFDRGTGALVAEHSGIYSQHGGTCAFSNTFVDPDDDFPLLYVSTQYSDADGGQIHVYRIQDVDTVSLYKAYHFDPSIVGYWGNACYDFETGLAYSFGYTKNSFTDRTDNPVKVTVIDLNKETHVQGSIYTLDVVDNYEIPYVYVIQSCKFKNGLCYLVSSYQNSVQASDIKVYDPSVKSFVANFPDLPLPLRGEIEDLDFVENSTTSKYDMIVGVNGDPNYWKLSFM